MGRLVHDNDGADVGEGDGGCLDVHSAIITRVLDGRWDDNVLMQTY